MVVSVWEEAPKTLAMREGYIWAALGPRGAGKNIFMLWQIFRPDGYWEHYQNKDVILKNGQLFPSGLYSNFYIEGFQKLDFDLFFDVDLAIEHPDQWPYWNSFIAWDEPHRELDKRKSMTGSNIERSEIIDQLRKTGVDCIMAEKPDRTEKRVEQNYDVVVECYKNPDGFFEYYEFLIGAATPPKYETLSFNDASVFWNKYRTHQMIESGYRRNNSRQRYKSGKDTKGSTGETSATNDGYIKQGNIAKIIQMKHYPTYKGKGPTTPDIVFHKQNSNIPLSMLGEEGLLASWVEGAAVGVVQVKWLKLEHQLTVYEFAGVNRQDCEIELFYADKLHVPCYLLIGCKRTSKWVCVEVSKGFGKWCTPPDGSRMWVDLEECFVKMGIR